MFSIVSMQDVLINLNGGDELFRKFDRGGRSRKRSTSIKSPSRKESSFSIQNIWILPSHVLVLSGESNNATLLAYNQYSKMSYLTTERVKDLLEPAAEKGLTCGVLDVFCKFTSKEYIFILLKDGTLIVWTFITPLFEWSFLGCFTLCKGKGCQVTSYAFNSDLIMWCEKRSTAQCFVGVATVQVNDDRVNIQNKHTVLHNCLPMVIHPVKQSHFCLLTTANRPPGLILFWNCHTQEVMIRVWKDGLMVHEIKASSSDFQNIITSSIPLWINSSSSEPLFVTMATHSTTNELIFLQQDLSFYLLTSDDQTRKLNCVKLFNLEVSEEKEGFAKRILKMYLWHRLVLLNMVDGELLIFDSRNGLFLWKTETFKMNSPKVWVRIGPYPSIGVWNISGIWTFRPKSIRDQIKEIHADFQDDPVSPSATKALPDITDVDYAVNIIGEHKKNAGNKARRKIKQGVNRKAKLPIGYMFEVLNKWKSERTSSELALHLMLKHIKNMKTDDSEEDDDGLLTSDELVELLSHIFDPVLLMALFTNKTLPSAVKPNLVKAIKNVLECPLADNINPQIINILKEYLSMQDQLESCFFIDDRKCESADSNSLEQVNLEYENNKLRASKQAVIENILRHLIEIYPQYVMTMIIPTLMVEDAFDDMWHVILSKQSIMLYKIIPKLWQENPQYLYDFIEACCAKINGYSQDGLVTIVELIDITLSLIHLPKPSINTGKDVTLSVCVYCKFLLRHEKDYSERCCEIYLKYDLIEKALELLTVKNSSIFFRIFKYLLINSLLKSYVDRILPFLPENQNAMEMGNILLMCAQDPSPGNVFAKENTTQIDIASVKPIFEELFKRNSARDERK